MTGLRVAIEGALVAAVTVAACVALVALQTPAPRLVGHGCDGASGPIYASEESDFPFCETIAVYR